MTDKQEKQIVLLTACLMDTTGVIASLLKRVEQLEKMHETRLEVPDYAVDYTGRRWNTMPPTTE